MIVLVKMIDLSPLYISLKTAIITIIISAVVTFIANFALLFGIKTDKYEWYLTSYVVINFVIWIILEVYFEKSCRYKFKILIFSFKEFLNNIKDKS